MLNQLVLIGKVISFSSTHVLLKVQRSVKNSETKEYGFDILNVEVPISIMDTLHEYLEPEIIVAIKASLVSQPTNVSDITDTNLVRIVAERASLLHPKTD